MKTIIPSAREIAMAISRADERRQLHVPLSLSATQAWRP